MPVKILLLTEVTRENINQLIDIENFSSYHRLLRITAYVLIFVRKIKSKMKRGDGQTDLRLTWTEEIDQAEILWLKVMQVSLLNHPKFSDWKREFGTFPDEKGIIRCGGRLDNANITDAAKYSILLDPRHLLTLLIVRHCHQRVKHCGLKGTLTELRSQFWIVRRRQFIRNIIYKCFTCRKQDGQAYRSPAPPPLHDYRVKEDFPFANTGIDFAGPIFVKNPKAKVWISLYTCCVTRAVHLDLIPDMSTEAFLRNFRRFCARRGVPALLISNNAKTFESASRKLTSLFECPSALFECTSSKIKWSIILEKSPWWGGFYERLVKSVKRRKTLGNARLSYEELLTEFIEIESILNSRSVDRRWRRAYYSITPYKYGRRLLSLPIAYNSEEKDKNWERSASDINR